MSFNQNILLVLLGPTAVGKTDLSIKLAKHYGTPVISADSRQIYQGLEIGTAAPSKSLLNEIKHHFIGTLNVSDYYSASEYESDVISLTSDLFKRHHVLLLTGGSMMYIDAVCKGIDDIPNIDENLRKDLYEIYKKEGLDPIRQQLKILDPVIYGQVDLKNYKRVIHALEVCLMTGKPYSSFRSNKPKSRPFKIVKVGLTRNRDELYNRINQRVDNMIAAGLIDEAKRFYPYKNLNSLNTVGYKEIFKFFDNEWGLDTAIEKIKRNTRVYARKQLTWFKRDPEIRWFNLSVENETDVRQKIIELTDSEDQPENRHTLF